MVKAGSTWLCFWNGPQFPSHHKRDSINSRYPGGKYCRWIYVYSRKELKDTCLIPCVFQLFNSLQVILPILHPHPNMALENWKKQNMDPSFGILSIEHLQHDSLFTTNVQLPNK
jgi:hypothetical protein